MTEKRLKLFEGLKKQFEPVGSCFYCNDKIVGHYGFIAIPKNGEPGFLVCFNCVDKAMETGRELEFV